jgi:hypothetical protein
MGRNKNNKRQKKGRREREKRGDTAEWHEV